MDENTTRNQKTVYYKKRFRRKRRNKGVAIAEKYANKKWVKRQKVVSGALCTTCHGSVHR